MISFFGPYLNLIVLIAVSFITVITGIFLNYHWTRYELDKNRTNKRRAFYFGVSLILFLIMIYLGYVR